MKRALVALALISTIGLGGMSSGAATVKTGSTQYVLTNTKAKCKTNYHRATIKVNQKERIKVSVKGKLVWKTKTVQVRKIGCLYVPPVKLTIAAPTTKAPVISSIGPIQARASIDPSFMQNPKNPLDVTFSYSASSLNGSLADGVLDLYWGTSGQSQTLACSVNVGGQISGSNCEVIFPNYGSAVVTVQYVSGTNSATETDIEDIENPNPSTPTTIPNVPPATTTTLAPSSIATLHVTQNSIGSAHLDRATAIVTDQNGNVVTVTPAELTYEVFEITAHAASVQGTSPAASNGGCSFATSDAGLQGIAFGDSNQSDSCRFSGGGFYSTSAQTYGVAVVYAGNGVLPGSTSSIVPITTP